MFCLSSTLVIMILDYIMNSKWIVGLKILVGFGRYDYFNDWWI